MPVFWVCVLGCLFIWRFFHYSPIFQLHSPLPLSLLPRLRLLKLCTQAGPPHHGPLCYLGSDLLCSVREHPSICPLSARNLFKSFDRCPPPVFLVVIGHILSYSFTIILMESWEERKKNSCTQAAILNQKSKVLFIILENWRQSNYPKILKWCYIHCIECSTLKK